MMKSFLYYLAGTNQELIDACPRGDQARQTSIGLFVLLAALLASISGGYAIWPITQSVWLATILGLLWGLIILNFDRAIISSLSPTRRSQSLVLLLPKLSLSLIISIAISAPIELRLFEGTINQIMSSEGHLLNDFVLRLKALEDLKTATPAIYWTSWMIRVFIFSITIAPMMVKMLSKGTYDFMVEQAILKKELEIAYENLKTETERAVVEKELAIARERLKFEKALAIARETDDTYYQLTEPSFERGFASAFDFFGDLAPTIEEFRGGKRTLDEAREAAIARDWAVVGQDLQKVLDRHGEESTKPNI